MIKVIEIILPPIEMLNSSCMVWEGGAIGVDLLFKNNVLAAYLLNMTCLNSTDS